MEKHLMERIVNMADLPEEPIPGQPLVEIAGDRRVLIEHHCGVTEYGRELISVRVKFGCIVVSGTGLELARMTKDQLVIMGNIHCVRLERSRR